MKKRLISFLLAAVTVLSLLPAMASAADNTAKAKIDKYVKALGLTESCVYYWNTFRRTAQEMQSLGDNVRQFDKTGDKSWLTRDYTTSRCAGSPNSGNHDCNLMVGSRRGCDSNEFDGAAQCFGFARYIAYYLNGEKETQSANYKTYTGASWATLGGLKPGDHVRVFGHSFIYYGGSGSDYITVLQANGLSSKHPCGINFGKMYLFEFNFATGKRVRDAYGNYISKLTTGDFIRDLCNAGQVTVCRYENPCSHSPKFYSESRVECTKCHKVFTDAVTTNLGVYMDVVDENKDSKSAPSHNRPYGDSDVKTRYHKGDTVYVVGSTENAFKHTWYLLSTGEWVVGTYLGTHTHKRASNGYCTLCMEKLSKVGMNATTITAQKKAFPVHFAPYGASMTIRKVSGSVTVVGKVVNGYKKEWYQLADGGWVFSNYLKRTVQNGIVNLTRGDLALNSGPAASPKYTVELAAIPAGTALQVYTGETSGSWYSVKYGDLVGYVAAKYITIPSGSKAVEAPLVDPEPFVEQVPDTTPDTTPTEPAAPETPSASSTASVHYPTDSAYTAKISTTQTNAVVVANIKKTAGAKVTACGLRLYDEAGTLLKDHYETITNVGASSTSFHAWYDINAELGMTLNPGTVYKYKFYTVVDGVTYEGAEYSFTTLPADEEEKKSVNVFFNANGGTCAITQTTVQTGGKLASLPTPSRPGYTFEGWFVDTTFQKKVGTNTTFNVTMDVTLYAKWRENYVFPFTDIATGDWYREDVRNAHSMGLINGKTDTLYKPNDYMTYAECIKLAACMHEKYHTGKVTLQNASSGPWYQTYVDYAKKNGIPWDVGGDYSLGVTRRAYVYIFYFALPESAYKAINSVDTLPDVKTGDPFAQQIFTFYRAGILTGMDAQGTFQPKSGIRRSEVATILSRMMDAGARKTVTLS